MSKGLYANALEQARVAAEDCPAHFRPEWRGAILLGRGQCVWEGGSDTAVWLGVLREEALGGNGRSPLLAGFFPARETMAALRQAGLLDEVVIETKEGLVMWSAGLEVESV